MRAAVASGRVAAKVVRVKEGIECVPLVVGGEVSVLAVEGLLMAR